MPSVLLMSRRQIPVRRLYRVIRPAFIAIAGLASLSPALGQVPGSYLPLEVGNRWVLRGTHQRKPVTFEVVARDADGFVLQSITPWGSSRWTLNNDGEKFFMTGYGNGTRGSMMRMPDGPLYLDFTRAPGEKWSNALGTLSVVARSVTVRSQSRTYTECIQVEHKAKDTRLWSTFAGGIGYVQFGQGDSAFTLDESASSLPPHRTQPEEPRPPQFRKREEPPSEPRAALPITPTRRVLIGLTPNPFAGESMTEAVMLKRLLQTVDAGVTCLAGTVRWAELEPSPGRYSLGSISSFMAAARAADLTVSYTIRVISNRDRDVPRDLERADWADPQMRDRLLGLIDVVAPLFGDRLKWLSVGYEIDSYFRGHPSEAVSFATLYNAAKERLKGRLPKIQVSSTITFPGISSLRSELRGVDQQSDFLSLTYSPLRPDFTVMDPRVVPSDFARMKAAAAGRKIIVQEIGYPTASVSGGSEEKQAEFYRLSLEQIQRDPEAFGAVNYMNLADLSHESAHQVADSFRYHTPPFEGVLQSMGLFNEDGHPKKAWNVFRSALKGGAAR